MARFEFICKIIYASIFIIPMILAAFIVSPFMGVPMVLTILLVAHKR